MPTTKASSGARLRGLGMYVLVADDDPLYRKLVTRHLSSWGYDALVARDGEEAWNLILTSDRAIQVNIAIMRAFVKLSTQRDLIRKLEEMEKKYAAHDAQIKTVFQVLKKLIEPPKPPEPSKPRIGFITGDK